MQCTQQRQEGHAAKFIIPRGKKNPFTESRLRMIEPHLRIPKPVRKPYLGNVFRRTENSAGAEVKKPFIDQTSAKSVACFYGKVTIELVLCSKTV